MYYGKCYIIKRTKRYADLYKDLKIDDSSLDILVGNKFIIKFNN